MTQEPSIPYQGDFERAAKLLDEVIKSASAYKDLIARAKLDLADVVKKPKAEKKYLFLLFKQITNLGKKDFFL